MAFENAKTFVEEAGNNKTYRILPKASSPIAEIGTPPSTSGIIKAGKEKARANRLAKLQKALAAEGLLLNLTEGEK